MVVECRFVDCTVRMGCEYVLCAFPPAGCHLLHCLEDRAGVAGKAHLLANGVEVKERPGYRAIQIEYNGFYCHRFGLCLFLEEFDEESCRLGQHFVFAYNQAGWAREFFVGKRCRL